MCLIMCIGHTYIAYAIYVKCTTQYRTLFRNNSFGISHCKNMFCLKYYIENDFISYKIYIQGMEWGHTHDLYSLEKPMSFIRYLLV